MNSLGKYLASGVNVAFNTEIRNIEKRADGWYVRDQSEQEHGRFDWVVLTAPAAQTGVLAGQHPNLSALCVEREMLGCFALMLGFNEPLDLPWDAAVVRNADISWMAVNSSKPQRGELFTMLVHSTNRWANSHIDDDKDTVQAHLLSVGTKQSGANLAAASVKRLHRWRYANLPRQTGAEYFLDSGNGLAACGDWFVRGRIEAAFTSATRLADELLGEL